MQKAGVQRRPFAYAQFGSASPLRVVKEQKRPAREWLAALEPEDLKTGSGAVLALKLVWFGSSHRRPTQAQGPIIHLPGIASLPGAHRHFRVMPEACFQHDDRRSWGYAYGPG
jgi:hypothetical protein